MIYRGYFNAFGDGGDKGYDYRVTLDSSKHDGKTQVQEITLADPPISISMEGDANDPFKPVKGQTGTLSIWNDKYLFDLYNPEPMSIPVRLERKVGTTWVPVWCGFVQESSYNQPFNWNDEVMDIDLLDPISCSSNFFIKKSTFGTDATMIAKQTTMYEMLKVFCDKAGIKHIIQAINYTSRWHGKRVRIDEVIIHERNFVEDSSYIGTKDDGTPEFDYSSNSSYHDIFEEIAKYLGVSIFTWGETLYMVNYENTNLQYWDFNLETGDKGETAVPFTIKLYPTIYQDSSLSLANSYNKSSVRCPLNIVDSLLPTTFDDKYLTNNNGEWGKYETWRIYSTLLPDRKDFNHMKLDDPMQYPVSTEHPIIYASYQYLQHMYYTCYSYKSTSGRTPMSPYRPFLTLDDWDYKKTEYWQGSTFAKIADRSIYWEKWNDYKWQSNKPKEWNDYIFCKFYSLTAGYWPMFSTSARYMPSMYSDTSNNYLVVNMSMMMRHDYYFDYPGVDFPEETSEWEECPTFYLECSLKYGNKYYSNFPNGAEPEVWERQGVWVDENDTSRPHFFRLPFDIGEKNDKGKNENKVFGKTYSVVDTSGDFENVTNLDSGYCIPLPFDMSMLDAAGEYVQPQITVYAVGSTFLFDKYGRDYPHVYFISDFSVDLNNATSTNLKQDEYTSDTIISNKLENDVDYVSDRGETEWKINSNFGKELSYSYAYMTDVPYNQHVRSMKEVERYISPTEVERDEEGQQISHYPEEWTVQRYVKQMEKGRKVMDVILENKNWTPLQEIKLPTNFGDEKFILNSFEYNPKTNLHSVQLLEKAEE